jgi:hypothetical protein
MPVNGRFANRGRSISALVREPKNNQPIADNPSMLRHLLSCDRIARQRSIRSSIPRNLTLQPFRACHPHSRDNAKQIEGMNNFCLSPQLQ